MTDWIAQAREASPTWDPVHEAKPSGLCFRDDKAFDLGPAACFDLIADKILSGHYYPEDAVQVMGDFERESRPIQVGDRIVQRFPLLGKLGGPKLTSAVEICFADRSENHCRIGYVTTSMHPARGIWSAELSTVQGRLQLRVKSLACPASWLFWLGLPYARYLQLRARNRAVKEFRKLILRQST